MVKLLIKKSLYCRKRMNMLASAFVRVFIKILSAVLLLLVAFLLVTMVLKWNGSDVMTDLTVRDLTKALFAVLTLCVANLQFSRHWEQSAVDSIVKLRDNFNEEPMRLIQQKLIDSDLTLSGDIADILLFNFLGYIEIGSIMLQRGIMTREQFRNQFDYILNRVITDPLCAQHIAVSAACYNDLLFAIRLEYPEICDLD